MPYCIRSDIELIFGVTNVSTWADLDGDANATKITNRIDRAILMSDALLDAVLRTAAYMGPPPLVYDGTVASTPTLIMMISAIGAGLWVYEARGAGKIAPGDEPIHQYTWLRTWHRRTLEAIRTGKLKLDAV